MKQMMILMRYVFWSNRAAGKQWSIYEKSSETTYVMIQCSNRGSLENNRGMHIEVIHFNSNNGCSFYDTMEELMFDHFDEMLNGE